MMTISVLLLFVLLLISGSIGIFFGSIFSIREQKKETLKERDRAMVYQARLQELLKIQNDIESSPADDPNAAFKRGYRAALLLGPGSWGGL